MSDTAFDERFWSHYPSILRPIDQARHCLHGFSGSVVWKVDTQSGHIAVRRFSPRFVDRPPTDHSSQIRARLHGWMEVPQPLPNNDGQTFTKHNDFWWDVCTWQPGEPAKLPIDGPNLRTAMQFIARWHSFWTKEKAGGLSAIEANAVQNRHSEWNRLKSLGWPAQAASADMSTLAHDPCPRLQLGQATPVNDATSKNDPLGLADRTAQIVRVMAQRVETHLHELSLLLSNEPMVFCHGDLHGEHLLFKEGKPTGLIDLSCRWDYAAADLARWLSTTTEMNRWPQACEWYREGAPLSAESERSIPMLAEAGLVIAALRWEKWLLGVDYERRYFPRPDLAYDRWRNAVERLEGELM